MSQQGAVVYVRVSDESQAETDTDGGYSLPVQRQDCRKAALDLGATFVEVYEEPGRSGTARNRPALNEALQRARGQDIGWFVVHKASRLARNARDALNIEYELAQAGVQLVAATEAWDESPMGKLMKLLQFGFDQAYSERLQEDVRNKMQEKARRGGTPHVAPQGYLNVRKNIDGIANVARVEIDPERASHITWAFRAFATGEYTVKSLTDELTDRGFTARPTRKYPERPISRSTVAKMLRNPYYIGIVTWGGQQYPGDHEHLTDATTFNKVQDVLNSNNTGGDKSWRYKRYLKGTLRCGYCHRQLGFLHGRGNGGAYEYFYCLGRQQGNGCPQRYIPLFEAEAAVERYYPTIQHEIKRRLPRLKEAARSLLDNYADHASAAAQKQHARISRLQREQKKLLQLAYDDALPDTVVSDELRRITGELAEAEQALTATKVDLGDVDRRFDQLCRLLEAADQAYLNAPDEIRRTHNRFWFRWLDIKDDEITDHELTELASYALDDALPAELDVQGQVFARQAETDQWDGLIDHLNNEEPADPLVAGSNVSCLVAGAGFEPATFGL